MAATTKPRLTVFSDSFARVSHRGLRGHVQVDGPHSCSSWLVREGGVGECVASATWDGKGALARLVRVMDLIADCQEAAVLAARLEGSGLRVRLEQIGGPEAIAAYDRALLVVQSVADRAINVILAGHSDRARDALLTLAAAVKVCGAKRAPKRVPVQAVDSMGRTYQLLVIPGLLVTYDATGRTYVIGERCEVDSYNLHYFGTIERITAKTVTAREHGADSARMLKIGEFAWRNCGSVEVKEAADREEMRHH